MSVNRAILIGNVGKDPEIKTMQDGREIATFSLGMGESWKDKETGERKQQTEWVNVAVFSQGLVSVVKNYVKKGSKLYVEGSIKTDKYKDKEGRDCYSTKVVLQGFSSKIELLDKKEEGEKFNAREFVNKADSEHNKAKANGYRAEQESDDSEIPW